jgi:hypothetical protein
MFQQHQQDFEWLLMQSNTLRPVANLAGTHVQLERAETYVLWLIHESSSALNFQVSGNISRLESLECLAAEGVRYQSAINHN